MSANDRQVGGTHYQQSAAKEKGEQHWDRIWRLYGRGYFVGCITKYTERYHLKGGIQDLEKAKHYLEKLIELETAEAEKPKPPEPKTAGLPLPINHSDFAFPIRRVPIERNEEFVDGFLHCAPVEAGRPVILADGEVKFDTYNPQE